MSIILSISSVLSLLSFLTTVLALIRVGTAAFTTNLNQSHLQIAPHSLRSTTGAAPSMQALSLKMVAKGEDPDDYPGDDLTLRGSYLGGHELVRMPVNWAFVRKPVVLFRPPSPLSHFRKPKPLSMAKLIMSRHSQRKSRLTPLRRPPGLTSIHPSHSPLFEEVA